MKFVVELHAFGGGGCLREVDVLDGEVLPAAFRGGVSAVLDEVFHYGQNDFQPKPVRSVSVGDIVRVPGTGRYVVKGFGFALVPPGWVPPADEHGRLLWEGEWGLA